MTAKDFVKKYSKMALFGSCLFAAGFLLYSAFSSKPKRPRAPSVKLARADEGKCFYIAPLAKSLTSQIPAGKYTSRNRPDADIGRAWARYYKKNLAAGHGQPMRGARGSKCYPNGARSSFQSWLQDDYVGKGLWDRYKKKIGVR
ncbi:MAG: hypothetical protein LBH41_02400 [Rickettsiales bacterium]|nr:hypothetical protein [Rickettsiales bacterium]